MPDPFVPPEAKKSFIPPEVSLIPQGTAKPNPSTPTPPGFDAQSIVGSGANILNNAVAGGALGSAVLPGVGTAVGAGAGALSGLFEKPSQTPGTDLGMTAGNLAANALLPGAGSANKLYRLLRTGGVAAAGYGGGQLGAQGDKQMQFVQDTPEGKIILSTALSALPQFAKAMSAANVQLTPTGELAQDIMNKTGVKMPLSAGQQTGFGSGLEKVFTKGSDQEKQLAYQQSGAIKSAIEKIVGKSLGDTSSEVEQAAGTGFRLNQMISRWAKNYRESNATTTTSEEPTGVLDASGNSINKNISTRNVPSEVDSWEQLKRDFNLNDKEKDALFDMSKTAPGQLVDSLMPGRGTGSYSGILKVKTLMKVLPEEERQQVGTATVLRMIDRSEAVKDTIGGTMVNGRSLNQALTRGGKQIDAIFSPEQADALKKLGQFAESVNPQESISPSSIGERLAAYGQNKAAFTLGGGLAGMFAANRPAGSVGDQFLQIGIGGAAGTGIMVSMSGLISRVLKNPHFADTLLRVSKGDATASTAVIRALVNGVDSETSSDSPSPASRLTGLFK